MLQQEFKDQTHFATIIESAMKDEALLDMLNDYQSKREELIEKLTFHYMKVVHEQSENKNSNEQYELSNENETHPAVLEFEDSNRNYVSNGINGLLTELSSRENLIVDVDNNLQANANKTNNLVKFEDDETQDKHKNPDVLLEDVFYKLFSEQVKRFVNEIFISAIDRTRKNKDLIHKILRFLMR